MRFLLLFPLFSVQIACVLKATLFNILTVQFTLFQQIREQMQGADITAHELWPLYLHMHIKEDCDLDLH